METVIKNKIVFLDDLIERLEEFRQEGKIIVQSHGIFDFIHPGIINHLNSAKGQGDILVVTVIKDKDIKRGPGRPIFPENFRAENVASLEQVDYVCIVDDEIPFESVRSLQPHVFAEGLAYKNRDQKVHEELFKEKKEYYFGKSKIYETGGFSFISSQTINSFLDIYPEETKHFLKDFSKVYSFDDVADKINSLKDLKVLLIGDGIIDEYHYCTDLGKSSKAYLIVSKYLTHEVFAGGAFAIANHIAGICNKVKLVTLLGNQDSKEDSIVNNLKPNVEAKFFYRNDSPTIVKKRYISQYLNQKLFEVNYLNDEYISGEFELEIIEYFKKEIPNYDLVLISDFGHGFVTSDIMRVIRAHATKIAVNTQTNAANSGYNMITKYKNPNYVCLDETEIRLAAQDRSGDIEDIMKNIIKTIESEYIIVTLGKKGSIGIDREGHMNRTPIFSSKVVDTVGAGDAFFSFTAPCFAKGLSLDLVSFIGNAVGALAVQIVCNKKSVEKYALLEFIHALLR